MSIKKQIKAFCITLLVLLLIIAACVTGLCYYGRYQDKKQTQALSKEELLAQIIVESEISDEEFKAIINSYTPKDSPNPNIPTSHSFHIEPILQLPELPSGCEITSLAMVLNHLGLEVDKCVLSDSYLPKGKPGEVKMDEYFVGNPKEASASYGCFAPVIAGSASAYITEHKAPLSVYNLTGSDFDSLLILTADDKPVIVWATINMAVATPSVTWDINGEEVVWYANEHCLVLIGYDYDKQTVTVADPLVGIVEYDMTTFIDRYNSMGMQAIAIF